MGSELIKKFLEELSVHLGIRKKLTAWSVFVKIFFRKKYIDWLEYVIKAINSKDGIITIELTIGYNLEKGMDMLTDKQVEQITENVKKDLDNKLNELKKELIELINSKL